MIKFEKPEARFRASISFLTIAATIADSPRNSRYSRIEEAEVMKTMVAHARQSENLYKFAQ